MMKPRILVVLALSYAAAAATLTSSAQVIVRGVESSDKSATHSEVTITTMDRSMVPLVKDRRDTKVDENTERSDTLTRSRLNDGSYFDSQRSTTVKKQISPEVAEVSSTIVEGDRQGDNRTVRRTTETVVKNDQGETSEAKVYTRNSSGQLVLDSVAETAAGRDADGRTNTTRLEKTVDTNGKSVVNKQQEQTVVEQGPNQNVTTAKTTSVNHLTGQLEVTAETTTSTRTDGDAKQIETVVRTPGRTGWQVSGRTTTTETTASDGSVSRETVVHGRSLFSTHTGDDMEPIVPQHKIVEHETRQADGTVTSQREAFRRDVNGDWKPESFSTNQPNVGNEKSSPKAAGTTHQAIPESLEATPPTVQPH